MNNNNNNRDKIVFFWVILTLLISVSMTFAKTVKQVEDRQRLDALEQQLNFPVLENWPAGRGEDAVWVNPNQDVDLMGNKLSFDTPNYKLNFDSDESLQNKAGLKQPQKKVGQMDLLYW